MANEVTAKVTGGQSQEFSGVCTVDDLRKKLNLSESHEAAINGEPAEMTDSVSDYDSITFSEKVKGGC